MSKTRCDMSATAAPYYLSNQGPVFSFSIGGNDPYAVNMQPGETWYLMIRNQKPFSPFLSSAPRRLRYRHQVVSAELMS